MTLLSHGLLKANRFFEENGTDSSFKYSTNVYKFEILQRCSLGVFVELNLQHALLRRHIGAYWYVPVCLLPSSAAVQPLQLALATKFGSYYVQPQCSRICQPTSWSITFSIPPPPTPIIFAFHSILLQSIVCLINCEYLRARLGGFSRKEIISVTPTLCFTFLARFYLYDRAWMKTELKHVENGGPSQKTNIINRIKHHQRPEHIRNSAK